MSLQYQSVFAGLAGYVRADELLVQMQQDVNEQQLVAATEWEEQGRTDAVTDAALVSDSTLNGLLGASASNARSVQTYLGGSSVRLGLGLERGASFTEILRQMLRDMQEQGQSINASVVTIGPVDYTQTNSGAFYVLTGTKLDGFSPPTTDGTAFSGFLGMDSQLASPYATMTVECAADSFRDGQILGAEQFTVRGGLEPVNRFGWLEQGAGLGLSVGTVQGDTLLVNGDFEDWTDGLPDNWTVDAGGLTNVAEENVEIVRNAASLKLLGNGVLASLQISQEVATLVDGLRRYCVAFWVKGNAAVTGTLTIQLEGTGYTAGSDEKITMNTAALQAQVGWGLEYFFVTIPEEFPSDLALVIKLTGTPSANAIYIDFGGMAPVSYHNGIHLSVASGAVDTVRGDRATFQVSNDQGGRIQEFFRRAFRFQLPSETDGSETIVDTVIDEIPLAMFDKSLVGYWTFDEASGDFVDVSGNGVDLTPSAAAYTTGKIGGGCNFGAAGTVTVDNTVEFKKLYSSNQPFTVAAWFKIVGSVNTGGPMIRLGHSNVAFTYSWEFGIDDNFGGVGLQTRLVASLQDETTGTPIYAQASLTGLGAGWLFAVLQWTGNYLRVRFNQGAWAETSCVGPPLGFVDGVSSKLRLYTTETAGPAADDNGIVDALGIWHRLLTEEELDTLYNAGSGRQPPFNGRG